MTLESLVTGLAHVGIRVRELERARSVYADLDGNVIELNQAEPT
jgi:catechol 2,3-dioxygenase-like lactoylglutathione lyase family enzyme